MNPETLKEIQNQLNTLPKKVRDIISTIDTTGEIVKMKEKHNLMLDQISSLELETVLTMIGLEPAENFVSNLKETLEVDEEKANAIAFDINELIFDKIRKAMMEGDTSEEKGVGDDLDRDSILNEIENPTPTFRPSTIEKKPKIKDNLPEIAPLNVLQKYTAPITTKNIIERKLSEPTHTAPKETEISLKKIPQKNSMEPTQKPAFDPYKETI
jgi:hypothetical protein